MGITPPVISTNPDETWRTYTKRVAMGACRLDKEDLKTLYKLINEKQLDTKPSVISGLRQDWSETPEAFEKRRGVWNSALVTTVQIKGRNAEVVTGVGESIFDSPLLPEQIGSIEYDTGYQVRKQFNITPNENTSVFLDFTRPSILAAGLPSEPTRNNSNWFVTGQSEPWATSLSVRLENFFSERKTGVNWLHQPSAYDGLLMAVGLPLSLWGAYRIGHLVSGKVQPAMPTAIETAVYVYGFFLSVNVFRCMFSYARWVFPKVELASKKSAAGKHRGLWATISICILASAIYDAVKALLQ